MDGKKTKILFKDGYVVNLDDLKALEEVFNNIIPGEKVMNLIKEIEDNSVNEK